jgi:hypothetical protein
MVSIGRRNTFPVEPEQLLVVDHIALPLEQNVQAPIAEATARSWAIALKRWRRLASSAAWPPRPGKVSSKSVKASGRRIKSMTIRGIFRLVGKAWRWFAELTRRQIQRGVHTSVRQLEADIRTFIDLHNRNPEALQMDQVRRPDLGFRQTLLPQSPTDFMWRTLDSRD